MDNNTTTATLKTRLKEEEYEGADSDGERTSPVGDISAHGSDMAGGTQTSSGSEPPRKKAKAGRKNKSSSSTNGVKRPSRPLSAYNLFFRDERQRLMDDGESIEAVYEREVTPCLSEHVARPRDKFQFLVKVVSRRWNVLSQENRKQYEAMAKVEMESYQMKLIEFRDLEIQNAIQRPATPTQTLHLAQPSTDPLPDLQRLLVQHQQQQQSGAGVFLQSLQQQQQQASSNRSIVSAATTALANSDTNPGLAQIQEQVNGSSNANILLAMLLAEQQQQPMSNNIVNPVSRFRQQQPNIFQQGQTQTQQPLQGSSFQHKSFNSWAPQTQKLSPASQASVAWANIQEQLLKAPMESLLQLFSFFEVINAMERRISNLSQNSLASPQDPQKIMLAMLLRHQQGCNNPGLGGSERQQEEARLQSTLQSHANRNTNPLIGAMARQLLDMGNHNPQDNRNMVHESIQTTLALQSNATPIDFKNSSSRDLSLKIAQNHLMNGCTQSASVASSNHAASAPPSQISSFASSLADSGGDNSNGNGAVMALLQMMLQQQQQKQPSDPSHPE